MQLMSVGGQASMYIRYAGILGIQCICGDIQAKIWTCLQIAFRDGLQNLDSNDYPPLI